MAGEVKQLSGKLEVRPLDGSTPASFAFITRNEDIINRSKWKLSMKFKYLGPASQNRGFFIKITREKISAAASVAVQNAKSIFTFQPFDGSGEPGQVVVVTHRDSSDITQTLLFVTNQWNGEEVEIEIEKTATKIKFIWDIGNVTGNGPIPAEVLLTNVVAHTKEFITIGGDLNDFIEADGHIDDLLIETIA